MNVKWVIHVSSSAAASCQILSYVVKPRLAPPLTVEIAVGV